MLRHSSPATKIVLSPLKEMVLARLLGTFFWNLKDAITELNCIKY